MSLKKAFAELISFKLTWVCSNDPWQKSRVEAAVAATHSRSRFWTPFPQVLVQVDHSDHWVNTGHLSVLHFSVSFKGALQGLSFDFEVGSNPQIRLLDLSPPLHVKLQSDHSDQGPSSRKIDNDIDMKNHLAYMILVLYKSNFHLKVQGVEKSYQDIDFYCIFQFLWHCLDKRVYR